MRKSKKQGSDAVLKFSEHKRNRVDAVEADIDALFRLPLAEFTGARNALAAQLKKSGRGDDAARVKALVKPSISAWAVNQLYWNHREAFDRLMTSGERFHKAQTSRSAGKAAADMRAAMDDRREVLAQLSDLADAVLQDAGHNSAPDTIHRITTTLEGISAYASRSDGPRAGRLTADVDPPGFELFGASIPGQELTRVTHPQKSSSAAASTRRKTTPVDEFRQLAEERKRKLAAARVSLQDAKRSLTQARAKVQSLEAAQKRADTEAEKAEQRRRDAEESLERAAAAAKDAARRARSVAVEVEEAASDVEDAELTVEKRSKELETLFGE
jgi:hypothetical protein